MRGWLAAFALATLPLTAFATASNALSLNRGVTVVAHTGAGAKCSLEDSLTIAHRAAVASNAGRVVWQFHPSIWANGAVTFTIDCAKGNAHASTETFLPLGKVLQVRTLRNFALHLVYWAPRGDMPASVPPVISQLERDVKASLDGGATNNPFAIPRAYGVDPRITTIDSTTDAHPYSQPTQGYCVKVPSCLGSPDVETEAVRLARVHRWAPGNHTLVVIFTAPSLTVCTTVRPCSRIAEPCGYHAVAAAGLAYADIILSGFDAGCGGDATHAAAYAVAVLAHEQNEAVVDPLGGGKEIADKCEGDFRSLPINGHVYALPAIEQRGRCAYGYTP